MSAASAAAVASPCTSVCTLDGSSGYCIGCWRTLDEIAAWSDMSAQEKLAVVAALKRRRLAREQACASRDAIDAQR